MIVAGIEEQLLDKRALNRYLDQRLPGAGAFTIERHVAGHSCETFFIRRSGREWVLRRPPLASYLPTAHDVMREHRVLSALADTPVRAPRPQLACSDEAVIGAPFYVMEKIEGFVIRTELPGHLEKPREREAIGPEMIDALAEIHLVRQEALDLEGFGKPTGYLERQLRRWSGQLELAASITRQSRVVAEMWQVGDWLRENLPDSPPSAIVHGDYKLDNVAFARDVPARLAGVFDWEMSTIGDPLADLGWMISYWREASDPPDPLRSALAPVTAAPGFSTRQELIDRYESATGLKVTNLRWYLVAALWKLACLLEGSYGRYLMGTTDDPFFAELELGVPALAGRAIEISRGDLEL